LLCVALAFGVGRRLDDSLSLWWNTTQSALRPEREMATFLRSTPQSALIVCAEASVEVLSGLSATRFVRAHGAALDPARVEEWSRSRDVYIVDRVHRLGPFSHAGPASLGSI